MIDLTKQANFMQNIVEVMSGFFELVVTIVDTKFTRIAGTQEYKENIGQTITNYHVFRYVMMKGETVQISNPGTDFACMECVKGGKCGKTAAIYSPIKVDGKVVAGLGIFAFTKEQKNQILNNKEFFTFIQQLSDLIASKLEAEEYALRLEDSLKKNNAILNSVHDGVIAIDHKGIIEQVNQSAKSFLDVSDDSLIGRYIGEFIHLSILNDILMKNKHYNDKEIEVNVKNKKASFYLTSQSVNKKALAGGAVLSFKKSQEVVSLVRDYSLSGTQPITFENIVGNGSGIRKVKELAKKVSIGDSNVLIRGESGTGKELFARAIHNNSLRSNGPFIAVNCAAIPEPLLESELFGYVEGAFTGARRGGKPGKCELAAGGTLFLDEVGDIPLFLQSKFLRMIQERTIERLGGTKTIPIDIRIICATHRNLERMIETHEFRQDLYYRLNVIPVFLPQLRDRSEDIYDLCKFFLNKYSKHLNKNISSISPDVLNVFKNYSWPGNIRELENSIEYAVNLESSNIITLNSIPSRIIEEKETIYSNENRPINSAEKKSELEKIVDDELIDAINKFSWTTTGKKEAAEYLGISIATLYRKLKKCKV